MSPRQSRGKPLSEILNRSSGPEMIATLAPATLPRAPNRAVAFWVSTTLPAQFAEYREGSRRQELSVPNCVAAQAEDFEKLP
jgi:hypothetical protein